MAEDIDKDRNKGIISNIISDELGSAVADSVAYKRNALSAVSDAVARMAASLLQHEAKKVVAKLTGRDAPRSEFDEAYADLSRSMKDCYVLFGEPDGPLDAAPAYHRNPALGESPEE